MSLRVGDLKKKEIDVLSMEYHVCCVICPSLLLLPTFYTMFFPVVLSSEMGRVLSCKGPEQPLRSDARRIARKVSSLVAVCGELKCRPSCPVSLCFQLHKNFPTTLSDFSPSQAPRPLGLSRLSQLGLADCRRVDTFSPAQMGRSKAFSFSF